MIRLPEPTEYIICSTARCQEDDPFVLVSCRDGRIRCAHHTVLLGMCADCGEGDPTFIGDDMTDGLCNDCRSAYYKKD